MAALCIELPPPTFCTATIPLSWAAQAPFSPLVVHRHISWEVDTMVWSTGCDNTHIYSPDHSWTNQVLFLDVYSLD